MDQNNNYNNPQEEEEGIDIVALVKGLWSGRKTIIIVTAVFIALGLLAALTMKRTYTVNTVMVPQMNSRSNSSLGSLAALAGFDIGLSNMSGGDISPLVYPQIVNSITFRRELIYTPFHFAKADTAVTMYTYAKEYSKPTVMGTIKKYTIGLPGVIIGAFRKEKPEMTLPESNTLEADTAPKPILLTKDEQKLVKAVGHSVNLNVDK